MEKTFREDQKEKIQILTLILVAIWYKTSSLINSQTFLFRSQTTATKRNAPFSILKIAAVLSLPKHGC